MRLGDFKILTFDCYGTLIDWEAGIWAALQPLLRKGGIVRERDDALAAFARHESAQEADTPAMRYSELLAQVHRRIAVEWDVTTDSEEDRGFGRSIGDWPAFADSPAALAYLKRFFKLVVLSNVDRAGFAASNRHLGVVFDAVYTAEDVGSYKPDPGNFRYMIAALGREGHAPGEILHVAQSLYHDHAPANACGLHSAWIDRRQGRDGGATPPAAAAVRWDFRFASLAELAEAYRAEQGG